MTSRKPLNYDDERNIISRKFGVLRRSTNGQQTTLDWITRKEAIAMKCIDSRLPKKTIEAIHSEIRVWVRDGLFRKKSKNELLAELAAIDSERT